MEIESLFSVEVPILSEKGNRILDEMGTEILSEIHGIVQGV
jgi:hypothetical protein